MNKIMLSDFDIEAYYLCAIHANIPSYKMAFLLNKHIGLQLERAEKDVEVNTTNEEVYPKYIHDHEEQYITYTLVKNKCEVLTSPNLDLNIDLFSSGALASIKNLVTDYKKVDYFLKIETESDYYPMKVIVSQILEIKQVITAYSVDYDKIKKKTNLIFE